MTRRQISAPKDVFATLEALRDKGVPTVPFATDPRGIAVIGLPAYAVARSGDGAGVRIAVARYGDIAPAFARAAKTGGEVAVMGHVAGHDVECGVMDHHGTPVALVPIDALPRSRHESVPWHLSERQIERVQKIAMKAHRALGAPAMSLVRCVVGVRDAHVASVDLSPALAHGSGFVRSAAVAGFTLPELHKALKTNEAIS